MKTFNPSIFAPSLPHTQKVWVQDVHQALNGSLDLGVPTNKQPADGTPNAGVYNQFDKGNGSGVLVRIAANGVAGTGAPYNWPGAGSLSIVHGLQRQPVGFHVVDADKDVRVFRTSPPTNQLIKLQPTDISASVTLYIF